MKIKIIASIIISIFVLIFAITLGSVHIPFADILHIITHILFGADLPEHIRPASVAIVANARLPRVALAFLAGAALSASGAVMQSVLRNPLASSYTLGVSSGASFGAALVIFFGISLPFLPMMTLPALGFIFGLGTIILAIFVARRLDNQLQNHTIILTGMIFALFINAVITLLFALFRENIQQMIFWQMGSFSGRHWDTVLILAPLTLAGIVFISRFRWELDVLTFGEEQAQAVGIASKRVKWTLLVTSAAITGSTIAFVGIIGFVDLVVPHIVRKIFGASHKYVIPMSAVIGGAFMVLCDLVARTIIAPIELPVGAITAIIGAPFFGYIYFSRRKGGV
ncbi:MAG: iron ABC transporter permease [Clostridiales bacterium]|jgi:iron complex transport system permease protein|nr:iron ABC transporter permease [Clostridiales bacterium]